MDAICICPILPSFIGGYLAITTQYTDEDTTYKLREEQERLRSQVISEDALRVRLQYIARTVYVLFQARVDGVPLFRKSYALRLGPEMLTREIYQPRLPALEAQYTKETHPAYVRAIQRAAADAAISNLERDMKEDGPAKSAETIRQMQRGRVIKGGEFLLPLYDALYDALDAPLRNGCKGVPEALAFALEALEASGADVLRFVTYVQFPQGVPHGR